MQSEKNFLPKAEKAYNNMDFLHSPDGRTLRLLSEYLYPEQHFRKRGINKLIVFFGSARVPSEEDYQFKLKLLNDKLELSKTDELEKIKSEIHKFLMLRENTDIYNDAVRLSEMLTKWSMSLTKKHRFYICTGGGPGMMEAANRGAIKAGAPSVGLNISLPFEQYPNRFISEDLNFEFHYFFMRKFWFVYLSKAIIAMPGGFGTIDEIFEILTLKQTQKVTKPLPIVFYSEKFWKKLINFDFFVERGMISKEDLDLFTFANTPIDAFDFITGELKRIYRIK
jgi:hypothetical protein